VSPVKYELGFYIPEDNILHSHRRENLKSKSEFTTLSERASFLVSELSCGGGEVERSRVLFPMRSLDSSIDEILPTVLWPWGRLSLQQK
jgi:hypothetical protein